MEEEQEALNIDACEGMDVVFENCGSSSRFFSPIVFLDAIWNMAFVVVSVIVLFSTLKEKPSTPLRVWVSGYALQCFLHCCEKVGSDEHNDFVHLVGDWVLLDRRGGSSIGKGFSSSVLASLTSGDALVYAVATRQGASADDIRNLPKYRYRLASHLRASNNSEKQDVFGTETEMSNSNSTDELALHPEDSVSIYKHFCAQF
ncbi:RING-type domain-containing protein [Citrus sinensis]|uniref:RING-type domain-containing protein n=1 Tax=Citrus sinensis TaxID=2711 RepID=A0ACB8K225_CITSI|nr:RING-type domain-containing protein [Citrus sinensis]